MRVDCNCEWVRDRSIILILYCKGHNYIRVSFIDYTISLTQCIFKCDLLSCYVVIKGRAVFKRILPAHAEVTTVRAGSFPRFCVLRLTTVNMPKRERERERVCNMCY